MTSNSVEIGNWSSRKKIMNEVITNLKVKLAIFYFYQWNISPSLRFILSFHSTCNADVYWFEGYLVKICIIVIRMKQITIALRPLVSYFKIYQTCVLGLFLINLIPIFSYKSWWIPFIFHTFCKAVEMFKLIITLCLVALAVATRESKICASKFFLL